VIVIQNNNLKTNRIYTRIAFRNRFYVLPTCYMYFGTDISFVGYHLTSLVRS